jgi:urease accessory protein
MRLLLVSQILTAFLALLFSTTTWAHPGHYHPPEEVDEFEDESFMSAAAHPFTGMDHLLAILVVGTLAAAGRRGLGMAFAAAVGAGFVAGFVSPPWLLAMTLVIMGGILWKGPPSTRTWVWFAVVLTGFLHGGSHAGDLNGFSAGLGLCAGTLAGVVLVTGLMRRLVSLPPVAVRYAGASVAILGVVLTIVRVSLG